MKFRFLLISVLVALMVIMPAAVSAQDVNTCFNLSEEDCAVIDDANLNLALFAMSSESFSIEYDLAFSAVGLPAEMAGAETAAFNSSGGFDVVMSGGGELPVTIGALFENEFGTGDMMTSLPIEVRLVDDFLYFLNPMSGSWQAIDIAAGMSDPEVTEQFEDINPLGDGAAAEAMPDVESILALATLADLPGLIDYTRDGDDFVFTLDLTVLGTLADPENEETLAALTTVLNEIDPGSGDDLEEMIPLIPMVLQEGTITIVQSVNTELNIVDFISFDAVMTIDGAMMGLETPVDVDLSFDMEVTNVNAAPAAVAPAEFEEVDPAELLGGL